jgi:hypothetical protein
MYTIEKVRVKDLPAYALRFTGNQNQQDTIPITCQRARAQANNPHADEQDIGLLVAYEDRRCIGYLGIMPGLLKVNNSLSKVYWFSTFFTALHARGKGAGLALVREAFSLGYDFVSSPLTGTRSEQVFVQAGMQKLAVWEYRAVDIRALNLVTLPLRLIRLILHLARKDIPRLNLAISTLDRLCLPVLKNIFWGLLALSVRRYCPEFKKSGIISDDFSGRLSARAFPVEFYRDTAIINWMIACKWLRERNQADSVDTRYFFSGLPEVFEFIPLEIRNAANDAREGFIVLSRSVNNGGRSVLKVLDLYYGDYAQIARIILTISAQYKVSCIEYSRELAPFLEKNIMMKLLSVIKNRTYLCYPASGHSPLAEAMHTIHYDYCDGDNAFF